MEGGRGGSTRLVEGELILDSVLGSVEGCGHLGDLLWRSTREMSFMSLPTSTSAGRPESRNCLVKRKYTDAVEVEAPCPPVVSSAGGEKIDPVAEQIASYLACLRSSARFVLVRTSLR